MEEVSTPGAEAIKGGFLWGGGLQWALKVRTEKGRKEGHSRPGGIQH